ncbi:hypothetical protein PALA111701_26500 [Paenibacillus lactis]
MEEVKVVEIVPGASAEGILEVGDIIVSVIRRIYGSRMSWRES